MHFKRLLISALIFVTMQAAAQDSRQTGNTPEGLGKGWSVGINTGLMTPYSIIFLPNSTHQLQVNAGYGAYVKKQLNNRFGVELDYHGGRVSDKLKTYSNGTLRRSFNTEMAYAASINGITRVVDFKVLKKKQPLGLYAKAGIGLAAYAPSYTTGAGSEINLKNQTRQDGENTYFHGAIIPLGLGFKTPVTPFLNAHADYSVYLLTRDNLDGPTSKGTDRWSYASIGLEYLFK